MTASPPAPAALALSELIADLRQDASNCAAMNYHGVHVDMDALHTLLNAAEAAIAAPAPADPVQFGPEKRPENMTIYNTVAEWMDHGYSLNHRKTLEAHIASLQAAPAPAEVGDLAAYDAGLLSDFGGGNVEWWQDYIRAELGRAHEFYQSQIAPRPSRDDAGQAVPVVWVVPGDDNAMDNGIIYAMAWQEGEFSRPLYAHPPAPAAENGRVLTALADAWLAAWENSGLTIECRDVVSADEWNTFARLMDAEAVKRKAALRGAS